MRRTLRVLGSGLLWVIIALCCAITVIPPFLDRIYYQGPDSAHFNGARFFNPDGDDELRMPSATPRRGGIAGAAWRYLTGSDGRPPWPDHVSVVQTRPAARIDGTRMVATWVGHATVLVQTQGLNILTDPVWSDVAGPLGVGPRRVAPPAIRFEDLPRIDLVMISHNHYDHMDLATLKKLWDRDRPKIVTSLGNDSVIGQMGVSANALDWGRHMQVKPGVEVVVTRNHHWSSRWGVDRNRAHWSSFTVILPGGNLFFAGDTGFGDGQWPREAATLGPVRLALIPIGAFRFAPGQMDIGSHIGPIQAAEVFARLSATRAIGIHWGTFRLSYESYDTPRGLLAAVMKCRGLAGFDTVRLGVPTEIGSYSAPSPSQATMDQCLARPDYDAFK